MKDRPLKDALLRHFSAQRVFVLPEIEVYLPAGLSSETKLITDIDVLALRPHPSLRFERILCDAKTLNSVSPVARALWLRGLMDLVRADAGIVVLDVPTIEGDHKLAASEVNVTLLSAADFKEYDRARNYPAGSDTREESVAELEPIMRLDGKFTALRPLVKYVYRRAWQQQDFGARIRHTVGNVRAVAKELDPRRVDHVALVCEAAAILSVAIAECGATLFHRYLKPATKDELSDALKVLVSGGREQYEYLQKLRKLAPRKGSAEDLEVLWEWERFLRLVREVLERPAAAFQVPWVLRNLSRDVLRGRRPKAAVKNALTLKIAMLVVEYLCRAAALPREFGEALVEGALLKMQGDLATESAAVPPTAPAATAPPPVAATPAPATETPSEAKASEATPANGEQIPLLKKG